VYKKSHTYPSFTYLIQFRTHGEFENENTFALAPSQRLLYSWAWELCFLLINQTFGVWICFLLDHCVTWESEREGGFMKIYWQWQNVRVYRGIALVYVYTTCMVSSAYLWVYTTCMSVAHICESTPPIHVYATPHVHPTSICLPHLYISTPFIHVYSTSTCLPHLYMYTLALHI